MNGITITKGWKTYLGAIILIATGLYLVSIGQAAEGAKAIGLGLSIIGIRHYLEYSQQ
jgi:hypothetical protein